MLTFTEDDFVREKQDQGKVVFVAKLSNGQTVYQDDARPGVSPPQAWFRLASYLNETKLSIVNLGLKFRDQERWPLAQNQAGYFYSRAIVQDWTTKDGIDMVLIGSLTDGEVVVTSWKTPELELVQKNSRSEANAGFCLIKNHG